MKPVVLIIDDDPGIDLAHRLPNRIGDFFEDCRFDVLSGVDAADRLLSSKLSGIDLVFTDIDLIGQPVYGTQTTGLDLVSRLRSRAPKTPVILFSSDASEATHVPDFAGRIFHNEFPTDEIANRIAEYLATAAAESNSVEELYVREAEPLISEPQIWFPNLESELLAYYRENPSQLRSMSPRSFEELVAAVFRNQGFDVELTPQSADGGLDCIAVRNDPLTGQHYYLIECKRYSEDSKVGVGIVRALYGVVAVRQATKGIVATTSFFTKGAKEFSALNSARMALADYDDVVAWLESLGETDE